MKSEMKIKKAAFTLVETIVAVAILSLVLTSVYGVFFSVLNTTKKGAEAAVQVQRQRIALKTIEDALSGIVYYEQNQQHYAFVADTLDFDHPSISFVSRVPPDFMGSKEFNGQNLRRIEFVVEDDEMKIGERALVMYQTPVLQPLDAAVMEEPRRWVLGSNLAQYGILFWDKDIDPEINGWLADWEDTNHRYGRLYSNC